MPSLKLALKEKGIEVNVFKINPRRLELRTQATIVEQTIEVAASGFGQDPSNKDFCQDVKDHVLSAAELYLVYKKKECIAFAAIANFEVDGVRILYLGGLMVKRLFQANGLMSELVGFEIKQSSPEIIAARTQNPCIFDLMKRFCNKEALYPYSGSPTRKSRLVFEYLVAEMGMSNIDPQTLIGKGTYGRRLYGDRVPQSKHEESNRFFDRINPDSGDSILFIGEVKDEKK